jgi:hypothetical protein
VEEVKKRISNLPAGSKEQGILKSFASIAFARRPMLNYQFSGASTNEY